jgi:cyclopropane-fatty-acyl-phospholipid synthase
VVQALRAAQRVGVLGLPPERPEEEASPSGRRHSRRRDAHVIHHHYDISNDFYELVLGPSMTYSCARFPTDSASLEAAQEAKHDLVCRKLGLDRTSGLRLLDVGCGWGSMALHAARTYGARVLGVTLSDAQAERARQRITEAGLDDQIEIRIQDYRDLVGEQFDAISSVGMFEHVGRSKMATYFASMHRILAPTGRFLNHAISSAGGSRLGGRSFIGRYVFPDGELLDVGDVVLAMERAGFEVRDVESLREHYAKTLRAWIGNLQTNWDQAVTLVGVRRARVWLLYMAASANGFTDGGISIHQTLGIKPGGGGESRMPLTRVAWR